MADFREELHISRSTDKFGKHTCFTQYDYCHTQTDLADGTVQVIDFGEKITLGEACKLIDDVCNESSEYYQKRYLKMFLEADSFYYSCEY